MPTTLHVSREVGRHDTAEEAVDELVSLATAYRQIRDFHDWAQLSGESVDFGSARIQYVADNVIPEVTQKLSPANTIGRRVSG